MKGTEDPPVHLALALRRMGMKVRVLERTPEIAMAIGAACGRRQGCGRGHWAFHVDSVHYLC